MISCHQGNARFRIQSKESPWLKESVNYQCPNCMGPLHYVGSGKARGDFAGRRSRLPRWRRRMRPSNSRPTRWRKKRPRALRRASSRHLTAWPMRPLARRRWSPTRSSTPPLPWAQADDHRVVSFARKLERRGARGHAVVRVLVVRRAADRRRHHRHQGVPVLRQPGYGARHVRRWREARCGHPFKLDKTAAERALTNYYKGRSSPKEFAAANRIAHVQGACRFGCTTARHRARARSRRATSARGARASTR